MVRLPREPNLRRYQGAKESIRLKVTAENKLRWKAFYRLCDLIAENPQTSQIYDFASIGWATDVSTEIVRSALCGFPGASNSGVFFSVNDDDRKSLAQHVGKLPKY